MRLRTILLAAVGLIVQTIAVFGDELQQAQECGIGSSSECRVLASHEVPCGDIVKPFVFQTIVEFSHDCPESLPLSEAAKIQLEVAYVAAYNNRKALFCDPYFRRVSSATIVAEGVPLGGDLSKISLEMEIRGELRCHDEESCNLEEIGLYSIPSHIPEETGGGDDGAGSTSSPSKLCSCRQDSIADRCITESEFNEEFQVEVEAVAGQIECSTLSRLPVILDILFKASWS
mmetsp:Transcript_19087/g.55385  ORF Transcript_19087/g.55385 Transcript_19087/m.55385 type:complete len:231 (-) Transcript_19087:340-1032(-)